MRRDSQVRKYSTLLLVGLAGCSSSGHWMEAREACPTPQDLCPNGVDYYTEIEGICDLPPPECEAVLSEHFGLDIEEPAARQSFVNGLYIMTWWNIGTDCFSWADKGDSAAECVYQKAASSIKHLRHIGDGEERGSNSTEQSGYTFEGGEMILTCLPCQTDPVNLSLDIVDLISDDCGLVDVGQQASNLCEDGWDDEGLCLYYSLVESYGGADCARD